MDLQSGPLAISGQLYQGVTEHMLGVQWNSNTDGSNGWTYDPTVNGLLIGAQTYSLLEKNGVPSGDRVGQFMLTMCGWCSPQIGMKGIVQFKDYDMFGNLISVASGTFTGVPIQTTTSDLTDPFWNLRP